MGVTRLGFDRTSLRSRLGDIYGCYLGSSDDLTAGVTTYDPWSCASESVGIAFLHHACLRSKVCAFTAALPRLITVRAQHNCWFALFDLSLHRSAPPKFDRPKLLSRAINHFDAVLPVTTALRTVRPLPSQQLWRPVYLIKFCTRARVLGPRRI